MTKKEKRQRKFKKERERNDLKQIEASYKGDNKYQ